jgi:hypothetical protein
MTHDQMLALAVQLTAPTLETKNLGAASGAASVAERIIVAYDAIAIAEQKLRLPR